MAIRWESAKKVAARLEVLEKTVRRWALQGWIEGRREGPGRLVYVKVHDGGDLDGRPVNIREEAEEELAS